MRHNLFVLVPALYTGFMVADATVLYEPIQIDQDEDPYFYFAELGSDNPKKKPSIE